MKVHRMQLSYRKKNQPGKQSFIHNLLHILLNHPLENVAMANVFEVLLIVHKTVLKVYIHSSVLLLTHSQYKRIKVGCTINHYNAHNYKKNQDEQQPAQFRHLRFIVAKSCLKKLKPKLTVMLQWLQIHCGKI